ncbi:helix-turn-helix transcriptional regulator [Chelativorans sp. AA-79]|uniref:helix-turn-helix domain-containing protein n=1 Tax=Chelativorans sp. AA-79 TaxID=3028735 RepID=UPI0023F68280|nr:helix-turn-helix transcriptional regulator [Chelativorans sp. AA-79]WEX10323.1 helix-turn-helix transcriptional regulator [Chelativorans sp. AA-79]
MSKTIHPLKQWRLGRRLSRAEAAKLVGSTRYSWLRWENGQMPGPRHLDQIIILTGGVVTANDWISDEAASAIAGNAERLTRELSTVLSGSGTRHIGARTKQDNVPV